MSRLNGTWRIIGFSCRQVLSRSATATTCRSWRRPLGILVSGLLVLAFTHHVRGQSSTTPIPAGFLSAELILINGSSDEASDPHVSGSVAVYASAPTTGGSFVRYYDFPPSNVDALLSAGPTDFTPDLSGSRIVFTRVFADRTAVMLHDASTGTTSEIDPASGIHRVGAAVGDATVAWADVTGGIGDVFVYGLPGGPRINLSSSTGIDDGDASVAPAGNAVVWERNSTATGLGILKSVRTGSAWSAPQVAADNAANPDTDGSWIVYEANRSGSDTDICFQPLAGGPDTETCLAFAGDDHSPSIARGLIAFAHATPPTSDLYIYSIAWNLLFRFTDETRPSSIGGAFSHNVVDISVLRDETTVPPDEQVHAVWAAKFVDVNSSTDRSVWGARMRLPIPIDPPSQTPTLQSISVTPANPTIVLGATLQFIATGTYTDSSTQDLTSTVTWSSDDPAVATILAGGLATGGAAGTASITATLGGVSGSTTLTVIRDTQANCHGKATGRLIRQYGNMKDAAVSLGFPSVKELQEYIRSVVCD